uniref:ribonuclease P n=1 Tax=Cajanus cajan TaxID=3821 RepID=A0A151S0M9_CAJCA|nr:hypothetical protein KK1_030000 [Cajanus cajan]
MARLACPLSRSIFKQSQHWRPLRCCHALTLATLGGDEARSTTIKLWSKAKRKAFFDSPEGVLLRNLNDCSKDGDVVQALRHYDHARQSGTLLTLDHYNKLLYLCSLQNGDVPHLGLKRGFEIFQQMLNDRVQPNEATFTIAARVAAAKEDPDMAFELLKQMKNVAVAPKLRSYEPALFGFCKRGDAEKAYLVDAHMVESGIVAEEPELSALLEVSVAAKKEDKVYEILHRLRATVRQVSEPTSRLLEEWFDSEYAGKIGREDEDGVCSSCGEKLVSIDIDPKETENFSASLCKLACQKEAKSNFVHFQKWLQRHGPFDAVVDGANVGLANGHKFSFSQLNTVVEQLRQMSPSKRLPLVILHISRVNGGPAQNPKNRRFIENWKKNGALYVTPQGSNDDWYWLYAAVSCKCLLLTNDEMRDHLFQLLGSSFFPRWKEKHQVRTLGSTCGRPLNMPPRYSIVIQLMVVGMCQSLHNLWTTSE